MPHYLTSDGKYRGTMPFSEDARSYPSSYLLGAGHMNRGRGRSTLDDVNRYLKKAVEAIAAAKLRGPRREVSVAPVAVTASRRAGQ